MTIGDLMSNCVVECTEDASVEEVYELLGKCLHRTVIVIDSNAHRIPIGVINDRSICEQVIGRGRNPRTLLAGAIMETRILKVKQVDPIESIEATGVAEPIAIIVVDENRRACGVLQKELLKSIKPNIAETHSSGSIFVNTAPRRSPAAREIPAFGWIQ